MDTTEAGETLAQFRERLAGEAETAYRACQFSALSRDYSARFSRDPKAAAGPDEILIDGTWQTVLPEDLSAVGQRMAAHLADFLAGPMGIRVGVVPVPRRDAQTGDRRIVLLDSGGGDGETAGSFTITVAKDRVVVAGRDADGLRDGVVRLVDLMGLRQAPIVPVGTQTFTPRLAVRLGQTPWLGSFREAVFLGYNAVFVPSGSLYELSTSDAIPELATRRRPAALQNLAGKVREAEEYGLRTYALILTTKKFPKDDLVFQKHPDIRGALTWSADGEYTLCTEHPLVRRYLTESMAGVFRAAPGLDGVVIIIGGEGFYHCFMRSYGTAKGHTNCPRCEKLGADAVVSNLCNALAGAIRKINPEAELLAWPYSAVHVWSAEADQAGFIARLKAGTGILTEVEKDEYLNKPDGVRKHLWDYSIDMVGLGPRAVSQLAACRKAGIPLYLKSEPEACFEAPALPNIPCLDRWLGRSEALAASGARGAFVFTAFRGPNYGTSTAEVYKYAWWAPAPDREEALRRLAARIAGPEAGPHLRAAWRAVSEAIPYSPELPPYYLGPYYLGPAHPMCADVNARLPEVFSGRFLYLAEAVDAEGLKLRPTYVTAPRGNVAVFGRMYREMERHLRRAADEIKAGEPLAPERCRLAFQAEASAVRWFYATARTQANFYESCQLRDRFNAMLARPAAAAELDAARQIHARWREVLADEKQNAADALPLAEADMRLDFYFGGDHSFAHTAEMIRAKSAIIEHEIGTVLPGLWQRYETAARR